MIFAGDERTTFLRNDVQLLILLSRIAGAANRRRNLIATGTAASRNADPVGTAGLLCRVPLRLPKRTIMGDELGLIGHSFRGPSTCPLR